MNGGLRRLKMFRAASYITAVRRRNPPRRGMCGDARMAKVEIYSSLLCPYCYRAKRLLDSKGIAYQEIDVMLQPRRRAEMIERSGGCTSVPQIFVDGTHIGNCDALLELESAGKLGPVLEGFR